MFPPQLGFAFLLAGTIYILYDGEATFIGTCILKQTGQTFLLPILSPHRSADHAKPVTRRPKQCHLLLLHHHLPHPLHLPPPLHLPGMLWSCLQVWLHAGEVDLLRMNSFNSYPIFSFIVILFVLFGGSVGAVVFLHTQYGWDAVQQVLLAPLAFSRPALVRSNLFPSTPVCPFTSRCRAGAGAGDDQERGQVQT